MTSKIQQLKDAGFDVIEEECDEKGGKFSVRSIPREKEQIYLDILTSPDYVQLRRRAYPPIEDFVDAYYWQQKGDATLMDAYIEKVDDVKKKYKKE